MALSFKTPVFNPNTTTPKETKMPNPEIGSSQSYIQNNTTVPNQQIPTPIQKASTVLNMDKDYGSIFGGYTKNFLNSIQSFKPKVEQEKPLTVVKPLQVSIPQQTQQTQEVAQPMAAQPALEAKPIDKTIGQIQGTTTQKATTTTKKTEQPAEQVFTDYKQQILNDISSEKDPIVQQYKQQIMDLNKQMNANQQFQMQMLDQRIAEANKTGQGIGNALYMDALTKLSSQSATARSNLNQIFLGKQTDRLLGAESAYKQNMFSLFNSIEDPSQAIQMATALKDVDPFFASLATNKTYQEALKASLDPAASAKMQEHLDNSRLILNRDDLDPASKRIEWEREWLQAKGGNDIITETGKNIPVSEYNKALGLNLTEEDVAGLTDEAINELYKDLSYKYAQDSQEKATTDYKLKQIAAETDTALETSIMEDLISGLTSQELDENGNARTQIKLSPDGKTISLVYNNQTIIEPKSHPLLSIAFEDWDFNDYGGEYTKEVLGDDSPHTKMDQLWTDYINSLPAGQDHMSKRDFKEKYGIVQNGKLVDVKEGIDPVTDAKTIVTGPNVLTKLETSGIGSLSDEELKAVFKDPASLEQAQRYIPDKLAMDNFLNEKSLRDQKFGDANIKNKTIPKVIQITNPTGQSSVYRISGISTVKNKAGQLIIKFTYKDLFSGEEITTQTKGESSEISMNKFQQQYQDVQSLKSLYGV